MGIRKLISSSLVSIVYFALAYAGDEGGWESKKLMSTSNHHHLLGVYSVL